MCEQVSKGWDQGSQHWARGSQAMGLGIKIVLRDHGSPCTIFVGSGTKICHAFGIKDQKFGYKNGISAEKEKTSL